MNAAESHQQTAGCHAERHTLIVAVPTIVRRAFDLRAADYVLIS